MSTLEDRLSLPELPLPPDFYRLTYPQREALQEWARDYALAAVRAAEQRKEAV